MTRRPIDVAFSPSVRAVQERRRSRQIYEQMEMSDRIDPQLAAFVAQVRSFYLATVNADGQPYIQHRGGPPGFLRVLDEHTLGFADFKGNRQYVTTGNLSDNPKAFIFMMDYARRQRIKVWGEAHVVEDDADLFRRLKPADYQARVEQAIIIKVAAWDANCPQHIPQMFPAEDVARALAVRDTRIADLETEIAELRRAERSIAANRGS